MKKMTQVIAVLVFVFGLGQVAQAQMRTQAIKVAPVYGFSYEKLLNDNSSLDFQILHNSYNSSFTSFEGDYDLVDQAKESFTGIVPSARFYVSKKKEGMRGFYVAPYLALGIGKVQGQVDRADFDAPQDISMTGLVGEFGGMAGWQWLISNRLSLGLQGGMGWQRNTFEDQSILVGGQTEFVQLSENETINIPKLQLSVGFAF